jgi:hypothetical protein
MRRPSNSPSRISSSGGTGSRQPAGVRTGATSAYHTDSDSTVPVGPNPTMVAMEHRGPMLQHLPQRGRGLDGLGQHLCLRVASWQASVPGPPAPEPPMYWSLTPTDCHGRGRRQLSLPPGMMTWTCRPLGRHKP